MRRRTWWLAIFALVAVAGAAILIAVRPAGSLASKPPPNTIPTPTPARTVAALSSLQESSPTACIAGSCLDALRAAVSAKSENGKLSSALDELSRAQVQAAAAGQSMSAANVDALPKSLRDMVTARLMRLDDAGRVQVARPASLHAT